MSVPVALLHAGGCRVQAQAFCFLKIGKMEKKIEIIKPLLNCSINKVIISNLHCAPLPPSRAPRAFKGITAEQSRQCKCAFMFCPVGVFVRCCRVILMSPCVVEEIVFYSGVYTEPTQALMSIHEQQADRDMTKHAACAAYLQYCSLKHNMF